MPLQEIFLRSNILHIQHLHPANIQNNPKSKYFIGSEWAQGLRDNYDAAMEQKAWGFITAPIHLDSGFSRLEDWMLDRIGATIKKLDLELQGE